MTSNDLRVGLEVESLLSLADKKPMLGDKFSAYIVDYFNKHTAKGEIGMMEDLLGMVEGSERYKQWSLHWDPTVVEPQVPNPDPTKTGSVPQIKHGLEVVSPILPFNSTGQWRAQIIRMFNVLGSVCRFESNQSCGFHVHLSPAGRSWQVAEVQNICIAILHFETAFGAILPAFRWGNFWAKTFRNSNPALAGLPEAQCIAKVRACKTVTDLAHLMNPLGLGGHKDECDRYYAWNLENLKANSKATIEWRQPEGMSTPQGCIAWMELATCFVLSARRPSVADKIATYPATAEGLRKFVEEGAVPGTSNVRNFAPLFQGKAGARALQKLARPPASVLAAKQKEDKKKNVMLMKVFLKEKELARAKAAGATKAAGGAAAKK